jgi:hypothetical protein
MVAPSQSLSRVFLLASLFWLNMSNLNWLVVVLVMAEVLVSGSKKIV